MSFLSTRALVQAIRDGTSALRGAVADLDRVDYTEAAARNVAREADTLAGALVAVSKIAVPDDGVEPAEPVETIDVAEVLMLMGITAKTIAEDKVRCDRCGGLLPEVLAAVEAEQAAETAAYVKAMTWPGQRLDS